MKKLILISLLIVGGFLARGQDVSDDYSYKYIEWTGGTFGHQGQDYSYKFYCTEEAKDRIDNKDGGFKSFMNSTLRALRESPYKNHVPYQIYVESCKDRPGYMICVMMLIYNLNTRVPSSIDLTFDYKIIEFEISE